MATLIAEQLPAQGRPMAALLANYSRLLAREIAFAV